jgi:hypothetical protein
VEVVPVTEFVGYKNCCGQPTVIEWRAEELTEDSLNLFRLALLNEGVEDDDVLALHGVSAQTRSKKGRQLTQGRPKK